MKGKRMFSNNQLPTIKQPNMKKPLVSIFLCLFAFHVSAQTSIGVRAGSHFAWQTVKGLDVEPEKITGLTLAAVLEIPVRGKLLLQPEVAYVRKGYKRTELTSLGDEFELEFQLDHVEVPLLLKYKAGRSAFQYYFAAGPTLGYASDGHVVAFGDARERFGPKEWRDYARMELGASLGGGIEAGGEQVRLFLDVRFLTSLPN